MRAPGHRAGTARPGDRPSRHPRFGRVTAARRGSSLADVGLLPSALLIAVLDDGLHTIPMTAARSRGMGRFTLSRRRHTDAGAAVLGVATMPAPGTSRGRVIADRKTLAEAVRTSHGHRWTGQAWCHLDDPRPRPRSPRGRTPHRYATAETTGPARSGAYPAADRALTRPAPAARWPPRRPWSRWSPSAPAACSTCAPRRRGRRDAPAGEFSAGRAYQHVAGDRGPAARRPAARPTTGPRRTWSSSAARAGPGDRGAGHRGAEAGAASPAAAGGVGLARVRNVVARLPGTDSDRPGLPGRPLRLGADRAGRQRRRGRRRRPSWRWPAR